MLVKSLLPLFTALSFGITAVVADCGPSNPCAAGLCCSKWGYCGNTNDYCGPGNCVFNCPGSASPSSSPPSSTLATVVTSNTAAPPPPSGGGASSGSCANARRIGYWESWSAGRACDSFPISQINANLWTHLNFAFALIDGNNKIVPASGNDVPLYSQFVGLKAKNPNLKTFIAVGGANLAGRPWSQMASTAANRATFINSALAFMKQYGFDGLDIDWEYPVTPDTNGAPEDYANFVSLVREMRAAFGSYGITVTTPAGNYYLQNFDLKGLEPYVDWFNVMDYDLHGPWDNPKVVNAQTNLGEIDQYMNLFFNKGVSASKVVLGLALYGRTFTLSDPNCKALGCPFSGVGAPGPCTQAGGTLSLAEISRVIQQNNIQPTFDQANAVKYFAWGNQWVGYDDADTLKLKLAYANNKCLAGTMVWAVDLDTPDQVGAQAIQPGGQGVTTSRVATSAAGTSSNPPTTRAPTSSSTTSSTTSKTTTSSTITAVRTANSVTTTSTSVVTATRTTSVSQAVRYPPAPSPTVAGTTAKCLKWYTVKSGDYCNAITQANGITLAQFRSWNTAIDSNCSNLWLGYNYCVSA